MRVLIAEDSVLFREGLVRLLTESGHDVVDTTATADGLPELVHSVSPDIAVIDVRMPPTMTDDGALAAHLIRQAQPTQPMLLLSQHVETRHSVHLVSTGAFGYLLKDRVLRVGDFLDAVERVAAGGSALDPDVVAALLSAADSGLGRLSARERDVLGLAAEGHSNAAVAARLVITERTVETHIRSVFQKLDIHESPLSHRRVLAVLAYLRSS
ncbi:DNA-binding NarL/FixJ family response regulator [Kribbella steppae]|uniref:DNA-binding NarL/FixJ family response regulator n=1 Tax=Kribbella steppae TaxID=2512223 RepID=A0A4V6NN95_9ACTN|nr:response regulator transcription factor [Kribbella steppae]TCO36020.1 DNA-binding NarL/FixJ family response regulator [Kribbella steppae]